MFGNMLLQRVPSWDTFSCVRKKKSVFQHQIFFPSRRGTLYLSLAEDDHTMFCRFILFCHQKPGFTVEKQAAESLFCLGYWLAFWEILK